MNAVTQLERSLTKDTVLEDPNNMVKKTESVQAGNLECVVGSKLSGWVVDSRKTNSVIAEIYVDNNIVVSGVASIARADLVDAGYTQGAFGFSFDLPSLLKTGEHHNFLLKVHGVDKVLSSLEAKVGIDALAKIDYVEGGVVSGTVELIKPEDIDCYDLELLVGDQVVSESICSRSNKENMYAFSVGFPVEFYDDCSHAFSIRLKGKITDSEVYVTTVSSVVTPWEYINEDSLGHKKSGISKISSYRYASLQNNIKRFCDGELDQYMLNSVNTAHRLVLEGYQNRTEYPKLSLPKTDSPVVSIVIPVHNEVALTYHCISSLILANNKTEYEVILVNDKSSDTTSEITSIVDNLVYVENKKNLGFLLSTKKGAEFANGEYIVFLNNDTEVTSGWLDEMLNVFDTFSSVGAVGSKLIYPNGKLQEAGGIVWGSGKPWNIGNSGNAEHPRYNYTRQVDYLSGAALMIPASVWNEVGGFSDEFIPAYYEDTDIAFKIRDAGYRTLYCPQSIVVHFEGMSNGVDTNAGIKRFQSINAPRFRSKWRHAYRNGGKEGKQLSIEMDRNVDFRALVIDSATPKPDHDAGSYAVVQEIELLQELGCKVTFVPNNLAFMGKYTENLQRRGVECVYAPFYNNIEAFLRERGNEYDVVYIIRYDVAEKHIQNIRKYTNAKIIFNNCDLHFLRELRSALAIGGKSLAEPINTRDRELSVMREVDAVLSYNEIEHSVIMSHNLTVKNVFKCPWVLTDKHSRVPFKERHGIAFLGGFGHPPNIEAVNYFVTSVMPLLRAVHSDISFYIYGSNVSEEIRDLECDDVHIEGFVENLSEIFDTCRILVAPLLSGAGIKGKVLESIAHGIPTVLSSVAAEATGLVHDHSALIASNEQEWCEAVSKLYYDEVLWNRLAGNAHDLVHTEFSKGKAIEKMGKVFSYIELDPADGEERLFN